MTEHERKLRPALAAIILVCFFMPFLKVSCGGQPIMQMSGFDLATGRDVKPNNPLEAFSKADGFQVDPNQQPQGYQPDPTSNNLPPDSIWQQTPFGQASQTDQFGKMEGMDGKVKVEPTATAAIILAALALLTALATGRGAKIASAATAALCAIALLLLKSRAGADIPPEAAAIIAVEWTTAFWVALIGSGALAVFTFQTLSQKDTDIEKPRLVIQTYQANQPSEKIPS